mmetsp:Transcript_36986/g.33243  ORF Transcript_36986/g.33243 Transcript_36986/m.33243 type:complete len:115 (+) Transcript_36986:623-967(+)
MIWDAEVQTEEEEAPGHVEAVNAIKIAPNGKFIISGGADRYLRVWDTVTGKQMRGFKAQDGEILSLDISNDSKTVISGGNDCVINVIEIADFSLDQALTDHSDCINCVKYSDNC